MLLALNHLWQTGLPRRELEKLGLALGADVPVFIHGRNTFAEGVGESFSDLELAPASYLVLHPAVHVPTAAIFTAPELKRDSPPLRPADWRPGCGGNDLEAVACARFPAVAEQLAWLRRRVPGALMTGSGACVFAEFPNRAAAAAALADVPPGWSGWLTEGLAAHPLAEL